MKIKFIDFKLKKDFDRIVFLHYIHFALLITLLIIEYFYHYIGIPGLILKTLALLLVYKMYNKTMKNFYYTFWTFSFFIFIYMLMGLWQGAIVHDNPFVGWLYLVTILCLAIECYFISSPLYYPRVSWWEYDFRYRDDLKIEITADEKKLEGRLTDIRRNAGCVVLFESLRIGTFIDIKTFEGDIELVAEVVSKRFNTLGRGVIYGVKFHFHNRDDRNNFKGLCRFFESKKRSNKKSKYHKLSEKQEQL